MSDNNIRWEDLDYDDTPMSRGEFVFFQIRMWEELLADANKKIPRSASEEHREMIKTRREELRIAIKVLINSYFCEELMNLKQYDKEMDEWQINPDSETTQS